MTADAGDFTITGFLLANVKVIQFGVFFGLLAAVAAAEILAPGLDRPAGRKSRWPANFGLTGANLLLIPIVPVTVLGAAIWAEAEGVGILNASPLPTWAALLATLAVMSLASYVTHRLSHEIPLLWRLHRVHHSDTHLDASTTVRMHPLELAVVAAMQGLAVALFGLPPWAVVVHETLKVVAILVSHANIRLPARLEVGLGWLLVTPDMHRVHHSSFQPETDSNYGAIFSVWDRLFGTFVGLPRARLAAIQFGLGELRGDKATSFWWQLWSPFVRDYSDRAPARTALELISLRRSEEEPARR